MQLDLMPVPATELTCQHISGWLGKSKADELLEQSLVLPWIQNNTKMFKYSGPLPRRELIYGDEAYTYSYSRGRVVLTAEPWPKFLEDLRDVVEMVTGYTFPLVIGNRYDSGSDHIGWHDDGRNELGSMPAIASVSLGETRRFQVRLKRNQGDPPTKITTFELRHGDLIVMPPGFQETHLHKIMKEARSISTRVNWTFRPWKEA